jgi:uncharacterized protein YceK
VRAGQSSMSIGLRLAAVFLLCALLSGCTAWNSRTEDGMGPNYGSGEFAVYSGARQLVASMGRRDGYEPVIITLGIIEFPFTAILDTVLLPLDLWIWPHRGNSNSEVQRE